MKLKSIKISGREIANLSMEDFKDWAVLIQNCDEIEGLTDPEKEQAKQAFILIREFLGVSFLEAAFESNHPLIGYFSNSVAWTRKWLISFASALQDLREQTNFDSVHKRLANANNFTEGSSVLLNAHKFFKAGYEISFDPEVTVNEKKKVPDLFLCSPEKDEELYVEVSSVKQSIGEKEAELTGRTITWELMSQPRVEHWSAIIHKPLSKPHLNEITTKIKELKSNLSVSGSFKQLSVEGAFELGIATAKGKGQLAKWARARDIEVDNMKGPPIITDEAVRLKRAIREKQQQIPSGYPNIIIIQHPRIFYTHGDLHSTVNILEEDIFDIPKLQLVIVRCNVLGIRESSETRIGNHLHIRKQVHDLGIEEYLFLFNRYCEHKLPKASIEAIIQSYKTV